MIDDDPRWRVQLDDGRWLGGPAGEAHVVKSKYLAKLFDDYDVAVEYAARYAGTVVPR